jgi:hypothetical protein
MFLRETAQYPEGWRPASSVEKQGGDRPAWRDVSALLKRACPKPVLIRLAFRTALPLPQSVGALAEALILRLMPEVVCAAIRPTRPLPEQIGALANDLV